MRKRDAALLRAVANALADADQQSETRELLRRIVCGSEPTNFKALLAAAPLEGIDLTRDRNTGRKVRL